MGKKENSFLSEVDLYKMMTIAKLQIVFVKFQWLHISTVSINIIENLFRFNRSLRYETNGASRQVEFQNLEI